jgi:hypothetical protein
MWAMVAAASAEAEAATETASVLEPETENASETEAEAAPAAPWPIGDEWEDLRQVLAGDDPAPAAEDDAADDDDARVDDEWDDLRQVLAGDGPTPADHDDDEDDELDPVVGVDIDDTHETDDTDETDEHDDDTDDGVAEALAALAERVEQLTADLDEERAAREALAVQLDRLAGELDAVLGEALADERQQRQQIEEALRQVQTTLAEAAPAVWDGVERRSGTDRRTAAERRRGLPERPLRARGRRRTDVEEFDDEPVVEAPSDESVEDDDVTPGVEERPSAWKSRLHHVAGSVSAWSADDIDRLRVD